MTNKIKPIVAGLLVLLLAGAAGAWQASNDPASPATAAAAPEEKTLYTCGMHPQVIQDHPGDCPICHMKLTPLRKGAGMQAIAIDPVTIQNMGIRTATVTRGPLRRTI